MKQAILLGLWAVGLLAPNVTLAVPSIPECKGALEPSVPDGCDGVESVGCCDVYGRSLWCEGGDLYCLDCPNGFNFCGWNALGYYDCGQADQSTDPSGTYPYSCGGCPAECQDGKAPCSDTCAGTCGSCGGADVCLEAGSCYTPQCENQDCGVDPNGFSCGTCEGDTACHPELNICLPFPEGCVGKQGAGCSGCECEECVCAKYPTCCTDNWDLFCATACQQDCGMNCDLCPAEPNCLAEGFECGDFCGASCGSCAVGQVCTNFKCCEPSCSGKTCGDDGCGGSCGSCNDFDECVNGNCVACQPACDGKNCGDDGCGGLCGTCSEGEVCNDGQCTQGICAAKCGSSDAVQLGGGKKCYCDDLCLQYNDCCDGLCESCPALPSCCEPSCEGKNCGDDGCGGSCGDCPKYDACEEGVCQACVPKCDGKACGDDGCGGICGACPAGKECAEGACVDCAKKCDGKECGDDGCGGLCGSCNAGTTCEAGQCVACEPNCDGRVCGSDSCGGFCGACTGAEVCGEDGQCYTNNCGEITLAGCCDDSFLYYCTNGELGGMDCGLSGCGWSPGENGGFGGYVCGFGGEDPSGQNPISCFSCKPDCKGKLCGDDGCGGSCGACADEEVCVDGDCELACESDCGDSVCGTDNCGESCGACPPGFTCDAFGQCFEEGCKPQCDGKSCGPDGCGSVCGVCEGEESCQEGVCGPPEQAGDVGSDGDTAPTADASGCGACATGESGIPKGGDFLLFALVALIITWRRRTLGLS